MWQGRYTVAAVFLLVVAVTAVHTFLERIDTAGATNEGYPRVAPQITHPEDRLQQTVIEQTGV